MTMKSTNSQHKTCKKIVGIGGMEGRTYKTSTSNQTSQNANTSKEILTSMEFLERVMRSARILKEPNERILADYKIFNTNFL